MPIETVDNAASLDRRGWFRVTAAALAALAASDQAAGQPAGKESAPDPKRKTRFQIACMTLPYARFSLERALTGIQSAGYRYVAWGNTHMEGSERAPLLAGDAPPERAKELARRCRDLGLQPVLMFGPSPESVDAFKHRIRQAAAAGVAQVLTMGTTRGNDPTLWIKNFKELGPLAREQGVQIVVKQHGGNTGTGAALAEITRAVNDEAVKISFDAGNVMDYLDVDPVPDLRTCSDEVRGFCIKDHRNFPKDQDCGPGFGEIDHYRLLQPVAFTGRNLPLCCENIFAPLVPPPSDPAGVDSLARRAREFLEVVIQGLQT
jgi:sugar phosphate isomerase/epimerase